MKKIVITLSLLTALTSISSIAYADLHGRDALWLGGFSKNVLEDFDYWESSTIDTYNLDDETANARLVFEDQVNNEIGSDFNFWRVNSSGDAELRYYANDYTDDWYGLMTPYKINSSDNYVEAQFGDQWDRAKIQLNYELMDNDGMTAANRDWTVLHETGHVFSLKHNPEADSVMRTVETSFWGNPIFFDYDEFTQLDLDNLDYRY
ncbi:hypothetical protein [Brevibacillus choshinensis]|uniref:hypothetical protein n=1 Tax=Brevibacillus choshinensis TaxID=54911 RepID=UPI002E1AE54E|nr:hypothetical protein [Brevibacillus choshinensis]MED4749979.1 hypothetical protein [Brevibacillus choshinensis]